MTEAIRCVIDMALLVHGVGVSSSIAELSRTTFGRQGMSVADTIFQRCRTQGCTFKAL